ALSSLGPRFDCSRISVATCSNSPGVNTERQPPLPLVTNAPSASWSRYFAGRITLPLASRECWNSPRNIRYPSPLGRRPPLPANCWAVTSRSYPSATTSLHFVAPYTPLPHCSTHSPPFSAPARESRREKAPRRAPISSRLRRYDSSVLFV